MNSKNSKTSDAHRLLLNLLDKIYLDKIYVFLSKLRIYYTRKDNKSHTKIVNLRYQLRCGMESLNYLMDHFLY